MAVCMHSSPDNMQYTGVPSLQNKSAPYLQWYALDVFPISARSLGNCSTKLGISIRVSWGICMMGTVAALQCFFVEKLVSSEELVRKI